MGNNEKLLITDESVFWSRRLALRWLAASGMALPAMAQASWFGDEHKEGIKTLAALSYKKDNDISKQRLTDEKSVTHYNNFYEFGLDKDEPAAKAVDFKTSPWSIQIDGDVAKPGKYTIEDLLKGFDLEERIYRHRCVEAWSMVIPWVGVSLASLIKRLEPGSKAKYVAFTTLQDPKQMPGQKAGVLGFSSLDWPYREGLRMDEAMHPLTLLAVGVYGKSLPPQNGAPIRLVVPWKYGFKGIKSIVKISFVESMPQTSWNMAAPREYGFFANVNPAVDHPRWSQAKERRIYSGSLAGVERIDTQAFNGYGEQVASLYSGMDLRRYY